MRTFETGATRDGDKDKIDYEGFLSPTVIQRYGQYMHKHRIQADGALRESDNWMKGIPLTAYMKSMWRHFMDLWMQHRLRLWYGPELVDEEDEQQIEEALCAILFNASGYLHEHLRTKPIKPTSNPQESIPDKAWFVPGHWAEVNGISNVWVQEHWERDDGTWARVA